MSVGTDESRRGVGWGEMGSHFGLSFDPMPAQPFREASLPECLGEVGNGVRAVCHHVFGQFPSGVIVTTVIPIMVVDAERQ